MRVPRLGLRDAVAVCVVAMFVVVTLIAVAFRQGERRSAVALDTATQQIASLRDRLVESTSALKLLEACILASKPDAPASNCRELAIPKAAAPQVNVNTERGSTTIVIPQSTPAPGSRPNPAPRATSSPKRSPAPKPTKTPKPRTCVPRTNVCVDSP